MIFRDEIERINLLILNGDYSVAEFRLQSLRPESPAELRTVEHFAAIVEFRRGNIVRAKEMMEIAAQKHGPNVNLLRDLVVCQYHLQDMMGFRSNLALLEKALTEKQDVLSSRSLLECELMVGKFLEEEAHLSKALEFYERAYNRAEKPAHKIRLLIQRARWHALYQSTDKLGAYYRELISLSREGMTRDLCVELDHSLMLIEMRLVGGDHAWQRIQQLGDSLSEVDQRLMFFDFIEGALTHDFELDAVVLEKLNTFNTLDPFEQYLAKLAKGTLQSTGMLHELTVLASLVPWSSYLRLLCLAANLTTNPSIRVELNRKIQLIVRDLDGQSQQLWNQRVKQALQSPEIRVEYSARTRSVAIQGRSVDLSKKKMGQQLMESLSQKAELTVDEAISVLWQSSFSPEHYHRLRMGIHRLNTLINKVTGLGKIIEVDSQTVRLRPEVKIRHADEAYF